MPKTLSSIWIHVVFSTKKRKPFLTWDIRNEVCDLIKKRGNEREIFIDTVNGVEDHLHVLIRLKPTQKSSEVVNWIKGFSSRWLNNKYNWKKGFSWQQGYGVFSVSEKDISRVRNYIYNQEAHHRNRSYRDEIKLMTKNLSGN